MNKIILTKDDILRAHKYTKSNRAAARYLGVSYNVYKRYALTFVDNETGKTLFDKHLNRQGKGIKKHLGGYGQSKYYHKHPLEDILEGRVDVSNYTVDILKTRLIQEGYLIEECSCCGFNERRVVDYKVPLVLNFKDKNKKNWKRNNLEFLCYNCYFLNIGNIWSDNQLKQMEDYQINSRTNNKDENPTWDLDETHIQHLKELGLWDSNDDGEEFIDRL
jgi:5-methylcytosine-specific restriction endonuclease McrA